MKFSFQSELALGLGAFIVVATGILLAWQGIPAVVRDPGNVLPLDQTVAVLMNIDAAAAKAIAKTLPQIATMPQKKGMFAAALLQKEDGTLGWAELMPNGKNGMKLISDDSQVLALIARTKDSPRLSTSATYHMLTKNCLPSACAYFAFPKVEIDPRSPLGALFTSNEPVSVEIDDDSIILRTIRETAENQFSSLDSGPKDLFDYPLLILHVSNFQTFARNLRSMLRPEPALVTETIIRTSLTSLFGEDVSPFYDLPPLLKGKTTLSIAEGIEGHLRIVLEGEERDGGKKLRSLLERFHARQVTTTVEKHTFDNRFPFSVMRQDESQVETVSGSVLGWDTLMVRHTMTQNALFLALKGHRYILSNDQPAFEKALKTDAPTFVPGEVWPAGVGLVDSRAATKLLKNIAPNLVGNLEIPSGTGGALKWRITQDGPRMTVVLRRM